MTKNSKRCLETHSIDIFLPYSRPRPGLRLLDARAHANQMSKLRWPQVAPKELGGEEVHLPLHQNFILKPCVGRLNCGQPDMILKLTSANKTRRGCKYVSPQILAAALHATKKQSGPPHPLQPPAAQKPPLGQPKKRLEQPRGRGIRRNGNQFYNSISIKKL